MDVSKRLTFSDAYMDSELRIQEQLQTYAATVHRVYIRGSSTLVDESSGGLSTR